MAQIEQLVAGIADRALRDQIAREVKALKERKQFGLVFERHLDTTQPSPRDPSVDEATPMA
jgi:hypothetical protein